MIGKHMKGQEFSRCLHYVLRKPGAEMIGGNVAGRSTADYNEELQWVAAKSDRTTRPLLHCSLSLAPGESLSDHHWRMLSLEYLTALGFCRNQFLLVRHTDTPTHEHVHLIVNRVSLNGKTVSDSWDYMRSQAVTHALEAKYGLSHAPLSWEERNVLKQHLSPEQPLAKLPVAVQQHMALQRRLRSILNRTLTTATGLEGLTQQLADQNVQARILHRQGNAAGISFELEGRRFSGSCLGQPYSLPKLLGFMTSARQEASADVEEQQFEPDAVLPQFHRRYVELTALVQRRLGQRVSCREVDLAIAKLALQSKSPEEGRSLIYSPDVQALRNQQGNDAARAYLIELMQEAQAQLNRPSTQATHLQLEPSEISEELYRE